MNFDYVDGQNPYNMPELRWHYGYPTVMGVMISVALAMLYYFLRKEWI
jgi:magnesium transporter